MQVWTIINITPDSFFDGSRAQTEEQIVSAITRAKDEGADRLDIGAFSTRPAHTPVSEQEELRRLDMALTVIKQHLPTMPLSIDTFRSSVVESLHHHFGDFTVNDIEGGANDSKMFDTVGRLGFDYVMMSNDPTLDNMISFFDTMIPRALDAGISQIIVDPGFGFGKEIAQNFDVLRGLDELKRYNREILVGLSRKSMIYRTLQTTANNAAHGTTALHWAALSNGATILRAHDTMAAKQTIKLFEAFSLGASSAQN